MLREQLPSSCLLVIDSAYSEYVTQKNYSDSISYAKKRKDIIVTHTFSKIFGLSSLKIRMGLLPKRYSNGSRKNKTSF